MAGAISTASSGKPFVRLGGGEVTVGELLRDDPPQYLHDFKREMYEAAYAKFAALQAEVAIRFSRNACAELAELAVRPEAAKLPELVSVPYFFRYDDPPSEDEKCWYLNFADPSLFYAYDSYLFAQDELQTLEHPLLASVMLRAERSGDPGLRPLTVEHHRPTPWIIENVPRWINVNTTVVDENGETRSIYGNAFQHADRALLRRGITRPSPRRSKPETAKTPSSTPDAGERERSAAPRNSPCACRSSEGYSAESKKCTSTPSPHLTSKTPVRPPKRSSPLRPTRQRSRTGFSSADTAGAAATATRKTVFPRRILRMPLTGH